MGLIPVPIRTCGSCSVGDHTGFHTERRRRCKRLSPAISCTSWRGKRWGGRLWARNISDKPLSGRAGRHIVCSSTRCPARPAASAVGLTVSNLSPMSATPAGVRAGAFASRCPAMKIFHCDHCDQLVFFENTACVSCGQHAGLPARPGRRSGSLEPVGDGLVAVAAARGRRPALPPVRQLHRAERLQLGRARPTTRNPLPVVPADARHPRPVAGRGTRRPGTSSRSPSGGWSTRC